MDEPLNNGHVEDEDSHIHPRGPRTARMSRPSTDTVPPELSYSTETSKLGEIFKNITIEPLMLAHMIGVAGSSVVVQNMYLDRVCRIKFHHSPKTCSTLTSNQTLEEEVESAAAIYTTYRGLIEAGIPIIFSLFLGPWTDVHGAKYPILLPLLGYFLSALTYLVLTFAPDLPAGYLLLSSIPVACSGGMVALIMSVFSFMSKITTVENRSFRVAMLEASWFLGGPIGLVGGGYIYKYGDFPPVFITSAILFAIAFIFGAIVIKDDVPIRPEEERRHCCADMFNVAAVKDIFATIAIDRPGKSRRWMHVMLMTICLRIFVMMGYLNTMYLFARNKFHWNLTDYTEYSVADSFIAITGSYIMVMITMKIFKLDDAIIGAIGAAGSILGSVMFTTATAGWMIYLGAVLSMFAGLITIVIRSMLSKIVAKEEIAKVFTFLACGEASMPLMAVPLYNVVFLNTNSVFPGAVFLISTAAYALIFLSFIYLYFSMKNNPTHTLMPDETESNA